MSGIHGFSLPGDSVNNKSKIIKYLLHKLECIDYVLWSQFIFSEWKQEPSAPKGAMLKDKHEMNSIIVRVS